MLLTSNQLALQQRPHIGVEALLMPNLLASQHQQVTGQEVFKMLYHQVMPYHLVQQHRPALQGHQVLLLPHLIGVAAFKMP